MSNVVVTNRELITFDDAKRELIRKTVAKDLSADEFQLLMAVAGARGLDPILRQIYGVKRDGKMTIQTAIDGYRLIAGRTGEYAGSDEPVFEYGQDKLPIKCKITVYRVVQGLRCAFAATAYWSEYFPGEKMGFMWRKMPHTMLAKVTEALALRKAFPADLSGLYVNEELDQATKEPRDVSPEQPLKSGQPDVVSPVVLPPNDADDDPGSYVIEDGQFKGKTIAEVVAKVGWDKAFAYSEWLKTNRPSSSWAKFYIVNLNRYERQQMNPGDTSQMQEEGFDER